MVGVWEGTGIFSRAVCGTVLTAHEYSPNKYVAAVTDQHSMIRAVYFTADPDCALLTDIEVNPGHFADMHKAMEFGLKYA